MLARRGAFNCGTEGRKASEGRIKTNPLCELVLVAMVTIITSHLGEQEQGEERGAGEGVGGGRGWDGMKRQEEGGSLRQVEKKKTLQGLRSTFFNSRLQQEPLRAVLLEE